MRILEIAPAGVPVRSDSADPLGATLAFVTDGLVARGHEVTLWADPSSLTRARRIGSPRSGAQAGVGASAAALERLYAFQATSITDEFDVVHNHAGPAVAELLWRFSAPSLSTVYEANGAEWPGRYVATSWAGRCAASARDERFLGAVYPGVPVDDLPFGDGEGGYLLYAAPVDAAHGAHLAVAAARRLERPLRIAGEVKPQSRAYFEQFIEPGVRAGELQFLGPLALEQIAQQAADALAVLHPAPGKVGFDVGAVVAMAAGAPVVGFRRGAMPEIVAHAETGFLVDEPWQLVGAVDEIDLLSRRACRRRARELFDVERTVDQLESLYDGLLRGGPSLLGRATHPELEALDPRPLQPLGAN